MRWRWLWLLGLVFILLLIRNPIILSAEENSLQELINQTPASGTLLLQNKTYSGNITITKPITIKGSGKTHIKGDGNGNVIIIKEPGHGVRLENLQISHSSKSRNSEEEYSAIKVYSDRNVFKNLSISDSYHGIYFSFSDENVISQVHITGMGGGEIAGQGNGIQLIRSHRNQLWDSVITHSRDGIYFYYANDNIVKKFDVSHTRYGLHYMYSDNNHFFNNHFRLNTGGAAIMHSTGIELIGNEFSSHHGSRSFGLMLQASNNNIVKDNHFFHNQRGLYIDLSQENSIINNQFQQNQIGVELWASSSNQVFTLNHFFRNTIPVITVGGHSKNLWSKEDRGNNWGEMIPLFDLNEDGIGDMPVRYKSSLAKLIEDQELVYLFLHSPSILIYEKMNQFLHKQEVVFEDPHPLVNHRESSFQVGWLLLLVPIMFIGLNQVQRRKKYR
jgi:nitrous oxidase accessory protein